MSELVKALRSYQQADEDGVMVLVSRQACEEGAAEIERLRGYVEKLTGAAEHGGIAWMPVVNEIRAALTSKSEPVAGQRDTPSPEIADRMSPGMFTMVEDRGGIFLMRGPICFGEVMAQADDQWRAWGYGLEAFIGIFPTFEEAARAVVKSAWSTLEASGLTLTTSQRAGEKP